MTEKIFDKADLLKFFSETGDDATVGKFTVVAPSRTLFGETETSRLPVEARTEALWCEKPVPPALLQLLARLEQPA